jgi:hypothetical protein
LRTSVRHQRAEIGKCAFLKQIAVLLGNNGRHKGPYLSENLYLNQCVNVSMEYAKRLSIIDGFARTKEIELKMEGGPMRQIEECAIAHFSFPRLGI